MSDPEPRFHVSSCTGYPMNGGSRTTSFAVLDSWYCYRVVASFPVTEGGNRTDRKRLILAIDTAARPNRDHRDWLAS